MSSRLVVLALVLMIGVALAKPLKKVDGVPEAEMVDVGRDGILDDGSQIFLFDGVIDIGYAERDGVPFVANGNLDHQVYGASGLSMLSEDVIVTEGEVDRVDTAEGIVDVAFVLKQEPVMHVQPVESVDPIEV